MPKQPVVIEAMQFTGFDSYLDIVAWWKSQNTSTFSAEEMFAFRRPLMLVTTLEGTTAAHPGDWIIKGAGGDFYPFTTDIFEVPCEAVD